MTLRCEHCRWWDNSSSLRDNDDTGQCRIKPPAVNKRTGEAVWPYSESGDWCGKLDVARHPNSAPMWADDGILLDEQGNRSVFDDVDQ
jgi:hypothetical protein